MCMRVCARALCIFCFCFGYGHVEYGIFATLFTLWAYWHMKPYSHTCGTCGYSYESLQPSVVDLAVVSIA